MKLMLIAFDLDHTAIEEDVIPKRLREQLAQFARSGGILTTASGRSVAIQEEILRRSGLPGDAGFPQFLISADKFIHRLQGAAYVDVADWNDAIRTRWRRVVGKILERLPQVADMLKTEGLDFESPTLDSMPGAAPEGRSCGDGATTANTGTCEETAFRSRGTREEVTDNLALRAGATREEGTILSAFVALKFQNVACAVAAMRVMERVYEDLQEVVVNRNTCYTAATLRDAGKGEALVRISSELRIEPSQVIAIGDSYNDLSMLDGRFGFRSAAVANAEDIIKEAVQRNGGYISLEAGAAGFGRIMELLLDDRLG